MFIGLFVAVGTPILAGIAALSAGLAMKGYGRDLATVTGKIWVSITAGIFLWFLGEVVYSTYYLFLAVAIPYPSVADVFYLSGYAPLFLGFSIYARFFRQALTRTTWITVFVVILACVALVVVILLEPLLSAGEAPLTFTFDFAYPLLDLLLLSVVILGFSILRRGKLGTPLLFVTIGVVLNVISDLLYSFTTATGTYYTGSFPDLGYREGYLLFALAFYLHRKEL